MRHPVGTSLLAIGVVHTLFGLFRFRAPLLEILEAGLIGGATTPTQAYAFWFVIGGPMMIVAGLSIREQEAADFAPSRRLGFLLLGIALLGAAVFPVSGFWLLLAPAILTLRPTRRAS